MGKFEHLGAASQEVQYELTADELLRLWLVKLDPSD